MESGGSGARLSGWWSRRDGMDEDEADTSSKRRRNDGQTQIEAGVEAVQARARGQAGGPAGAVYCGPFVRVGEGKCIMLSLRLIHPCFMHQRMSVSGHRNHTIPHGIGGESRQITAHTTT
jgi:hypothetical protein